MTMVGGDGPRPRRRINLFSLVEGVLTLTLAIIIIFSGHYVLTRRLGVPSPVGGNLPGVAPAGH